MDDPGLMPKTLLFTNQLQQGAKNASSQCKCGGYTRIVNLGQDLDKHCLRYLKKANNANEAECKRAWTKICDQTFRDNDEIILINKTIDKYNLMVPMLQSQKFHLNLDKELDKGKYFTKKVKAVKITK